MVLSFKVSKVFVRCIQILIPWTWHRRPVWGNLKCDFPLNGELLIPLGVSRVITWEHWFSSGIFLSPRSVLHVIGCENFWLGYCAPGENRLSRCIRPTTWRKTSKTKTGSHRQSICLFLLLSCMAPSKSSRLKNANFSRGNLSWQCRCDIVLLWPLLGEFVEGRPLFSWHSCEVVGLVGVVQSPLPGFTVGEII